MLVLLVMVTRYAPATIAPALKDLSGDRVRLRGIIGFLVQGRGKD